jgi:hypothetical protein
MMPRRRTMAARRATESFGRKAGLMPGIGVEDWSIKMTFRMIR